MMDSATISSLATAGGTLVLAMSTFAAVRSSNRAARAAEESLLVGLRPLLVPSRLDDPAQKVGYADGKWVRVEGSGAAAEASDDAVYWQGTFRDPASPAFAAAKAAVEAREQVAVEVLYGDYQGGQRMIGRFGLTPREDGGWLAAVARHWNSDRAAPR